MSVKASSWRRIVAAILMVLLLIATAVFLYQQRGELVELLAGFPPQSMLGLAILRLAVFGLFVKANLSLMQPVAPQLRYRELFVLSTAGSLAGYFTPAGGSMATKALYLRRRHGFAYLRFGALQLVLLLLCLAASALVGIIGLLALWIGQGQSAPVLWCVIAAGLTIGTLPFLIGPSLQRWLVLRGGRVAGWLGTWKEVISSRRVVFSLAVWLVMRALAAFITMGWLFTLLSDQPGAFWAGGVIESATVVFQIVRITPGNVGVYEWVVSLLGSQMSIGLVNGLLAAAGYRLLGVLVTVAASALLLLAWPTSNAGSKRYKKDHEFE